MPKGVVERLAAAIADGEPVDWAEVRRQTSASPERKTAEGLYAIATIAESTSGARRADATGPAGERSVRWVLRMALVLAVAQVTVGAAGAFLGGAGGERRGGSLAVVAAAFALSGLWLTLGAGRDRRAWYLGGFLLTVGTAFSYRLSVVAAAHLPSLLSSGTVWHGVLPEAFFPAFLWRFAQTFPRVLRMTSLEPVLRWGPRLALVVSIACFLGNLAAAIGTPSHPASDPHFGALARDHPGGAYWLPLFGMAAGALATIWARRRHAVGAERRQSTVFLGALVLGFAPVLVYVIAVLAWPGFGAWIDRPDRLAATRWLTQSALLVLPLATVYAVMGYRLIDVRLAIGRALQRLLVQSVLTVLAVLPTAALAILLYVNRASRLDAVLGGTPARVLAGAALLGLLLGALRAPLSHLVDRHFLGAPPDLQASMVRVSGDLQQALTPEAVTAMAVESVQDVLQLETAALLGAAEGGESFRVLAGRARELPRESALTDLASIRALRVDPESAQSAFSLLPESDRHWVVDSGAAIVVGLVDGKGALAWILSAGRKRTGLALSSDEERFVEALALSTAMALENRALRTGVTMSGRRPGDATAGVCSSCRRAAPGTEGDACHCGGALAAAPLPYELAGKFRLVRLAGRGGMGVVYEAEDLALGRRVALKTLPHVSAAHAARLRIEARAMAGFLHPNLGLIYGAETWRGVPVLVMEYLEGDTLAARIASCGLSPRETIRIGLAVAEALTAVHARGLVHRDVKPSNIAFAGDGTIKLLDFGLAQILGVPPVDLFRSDPMDWSATPSGHVMGTPFYLSPEALTGDTDSAAQDLWSLGVVLYECVVGSTELRRRTHRRSFASGQRPTLHDLGPACPPGLADLIVRSLSLDSSRRPGSARAVAATLASLTEAAGVQETANERSSSRREKE